ncbi:MAG: N-6 DNA methylase [Methanophagales archaeon]|nr:N-6 DNA methylase [Methanophagales archaeon]
MVRKNNLTKPLDLFATTLIPLDLPEGLKQIYYYLYSNSNIPRAERLGVEMIRILFCKIYDEIHNKNNKEFVIILHESEQETGNRVRKLFEKVKTAYPDVFDKEERFCSVYGIDKEIDLVKICKAYMAIVGDGHANIFCADSLHRESWSDAMKKRIEDGGFDVVLTNPPFGAKIFIEDKKILKNYKLGHEWIKEHSNEWKITNSVSKQVPQILFIERCLQLLKLDGRMAIVLPDGIFGNPSDRYVWHFILENAKISAIISLPPETFLPSTHTKGNYILDNRRNKIIDDDLPLIVSKYQEFIEKSYIHRQSHLGFTIKLSEIGDYIFVPSYYDPETMQKLKEMEKTGMYRLMTIRELVEQGAISVKRGHEVGSRYYGMGDVPFVRTSDIVNWEIKIDPVKSIPEEVYEKYRKRQDIKENDILLVTEGTFLIGRTAIVTSFDKKLVIQSHLRRIRCLKPDNLHPYLLLYLLNTEIMQKQIEEKTFVQATISTVGDRFYEIVLPVPTDKEIISWITNDISEIIKMKVEARRKMEDLIKCGREA